MITLQTYIKESIDVENVIYLMDKYINNDESTSNAINELLSYYSFLKSSKDGLGRMIYVDLGWDKQRILEFINFFNNDASGMVGIDNPNNLPSFYTSDLSDEKDLNDFLVWTTSQLKNILGTIVNNATYISRKMKDGEMSKDMLEAYSSYRYGHETVWQKIKKWFKKLFDIDPDSSPTKPIYHTITGCSLDKDNVITSQNGEGYLKGRERRKQFETTVDEISIEHLQRYTLNKVKQNTNLLTKAGDFSRAVKMMYNKEFLADYDDPDHVYVILNTNKDCENDKTFAEAIDILGLDPDENLVNLICVDIHEKIINKNDLVACVLSEFADLVEESKRYIDKKKGKNFDRIQVKVKNYNKWMNDFINVFNTKSDYKYKFKQVSSDNKCTVWELSTKK